MANEALDIPGYLILANEAAYLTLKREWNNYQIIIKTTKKYCCILLISCCKEDKKTI